MDEELEEGAEEGTVGSEDDDEIDGEASRIAKGAFLRGGRREGREGPGEVGAKAMAGACEANADIGAQDCRTRLLARSLDAPLDYATL